MPYRKDRTMKMIGFSPAEWEVVCRRSAELRMRTGTYIRTISVQGIIKYYSLKELNDVYRALNRIGVNLNQIATVANSTGSIYQKDLQIKVKGLCEDFI